MEEDPFRDWNHFKRRLINRFTHIIEDDRGKRLFSICQKGFILNYVNEFQELRALVKGVDEKNLEHAFFSGLNLR